MSQGQHRPAAQPVRRTGASEVAGGRPLLRRIGFGWRKFRWVFFAYFAMCGLFVVSSAEVWPQDTGWFAQYFTSDFAASFRASLLQDLIFFGGLGFVVFLLTLRNPAQDVLAQRVAYIYANPGASDEAIHFNKESIEQLALTIKRADIGIAILEAYEPKSAKEPLLKVEIWYKIDLQNLFANLPFKDAFVPISIVVDKVDLTAGLPAGDVMMVRITEPGDSRPIDKAHLCGPLQAGEKTVRGMELEVPAEGSVFYEVRYWVYVAADEPYAVDLNRFATRCAVEVENRTNREVTLYAVEKKVVQPGREDSKVLHGEVRLAPNTHGRKGGGSSETLFDGALRPTERIEFCWTPPKESSSADPQPEQGRA